MKITDYGSIAIGLLAFNVSLICLWKWTVLPVEDVIIMSFFIMFFSTAAAWFGFDAWNRRLQRKRRRIIAHRHRTAEC